MKFEKYILLISLICLLLNAPLAYAEPLVPDIDSEAYVLLDASNGQVLYEKNSDLKLYPASTTKIMTAIVALENGKLDQRMTAGQAAIDDIGPGGMNIGIMPGEELTLEDLLNALLVRSANETAYIIADNLCNTRQDFVDLMNKKATDLGLVNTYFVNPCGMDQEKPTEKHLTTASDLSKIALYAMKIPKFREIVGKKNCTLPPTNKHPDAVTLTSTNKLITNDIYNPYPLSIVTGIKTGYTDKAGHNLVSSARSDNGSELISVILGVKNQSADKVFEYSKVLLNFGFKNFTPHRIVTRGEFIKSISVDGAFGKNSVALLAADDLNAMFPNGVATPEIEKIEYIKSVAKAPVLLGDPIGFIEYRANGQMLGKVSILAAEDVPGSAFMQTVGRVVWQIIQITSIALLILVILRGILRKLSRRANARY